MAEEDFLTVPEVAKRLRVTAMTVYRWIEDGRLPAVQIAKHYRIRSDALDAMLDSARVGADRDDPWGVEPPSRPSVTE